MSVRRANRVRELNFDTGDYSHEDVELTETMLAVLGTQRASLEVLSITAPGVGLAGAQIAALTALTHLKYLTVSSRLL